MSEGEGEGEGKRSDLSTARFDIAVSHITGSRPRRGSEATQMRVEKRVRWHAIVSGIRRAVEFGSSRTGRIVESVLVVLRGQAADRMRRGQRRVGARIERRIFSYSPVEGKWALNSFLLLILSSIKSAFICIGICYSWVHAHIAYVNYI